MPSPHPSPTENLQDCRVEENAGRKLAEEALRESEVRLCMAVKAANVGLWDWDLLANTVYYSPEWKRQIGYNDEEISDRIDEWQSRVHPEDLGPALQRMAAHLENPQNRYETEVRLRHRDGSYRWIYSQADLLHDAVGNPVRMLGCHIDITERKQAAEALRESDARLRLAVEAGNVGLWDWDLQTNAVHLSPEWKMQIGYTDEEIPNHFDEWESRVHPEDLGPVLRKISAFLENPKKRHEVEFRLRHKDGSYRWIYAQGDIVRASAGKPVRMLGCHIDITDRKRAEEAVRESETRFRQIVDTAEEGIWTIDTQERINFVNPKMAWMLGYAVEEILGRGLYDFMDDEARAEAIEYVRRRKEGVTEQFDFRMRRKDGSALWMRVATNPILDASGTYVGALAMLTDITERRCAEDAVRDSEVRYRQLFDANPHPMWVFDLESLRFLAVNAAAIAHFGYSREEFLAMTIKDIRPPEDIPALLANVAAVTEGLRAPTVWRHCKRDGTIINVEINSHMLEFAGHRAEVVLAHDITERLRTEARLLQAQDEERRRIAKELHDSTAQDLVAVTMNLSALQESLAPGDTKAARILADTIALVENSVNDIRTLSYVLHPPRLDETGLTGALVEYTAGITARTDMRIRLEVAPYFGRLPEDMEIVLFRVVQEGIANVLRHARSDAATIRLSHKAGHAVLQIEDYGCGMADAAARGVGIAGMRERLQQLGGWLEIESDSGGTILRAVLPLRENEK